MNPILPQTDLSEHEQQRLEELTRDTRARLERPGRGQVRLEPEDPGIHFTLLIEARDFLREHLPKLTDVQRRTVLAWAGGKSCREIAREEDVTYEAVHCRLSAGLLKLRRLAGV